MNTRTVNGAFGRYLKQFGTAENILGNKESKGFILTIFYTIGNCRDNFKNRDGGGNILTAFGTVENFFGG